jgi:hypothetical protein
MEDLVLRWRVMVALERRGVPSSSREAIWDALVNRARDLGFSIYRSPRELASEYFRRGDWP